MNEPIFIVGSPRSGTTLLAAMMGAHSRLSCGPETHFFRWLSKTDVDDLIAPSQWPEAAARFVESITRTDFSGGARRALIDDYGLDGTQVRESLGSSDPSVEAMLASVAAPLMRQGGKMRWAEKTPDHIEHVEAIRQYFPNSPILRMVRDPRDVALSLTHVPWGVSSLLEGLLFWKRQDDASRRFFDSDDHSLTVRFEDLVAAPRQELDKITTFLGEEFEPSMLDTSQTGRMVNKRDVAWKSKASQPIDRSRLEVWRREISAEENCMAEAILGDRLGAYGYPRLNRFETLGELYPDLASAAKFEGPLRSVAAEGIRFWRANGSEQVTARVYLGDPGEASWKKGGDTRDLRQYLVITQMIIKDMLGAKMRVFWAPSQFRDNWSGVGAALLKWLLGRYTIGQ